MWKWVAIVGLVLVGSCVGGVAYLEGSGKLKQIREQLDPKSKGLEVRLEEVVRGDLVRTVSAPGTVEPRTAIEISAQVAARIVELPFREGQAVRKGDVVVRLDAEDLAALVDSARAQLSSERARLEGARAGYANASLELGRLRELLATQDVPRSQVDAAEAEHARAEATLRSAEFAVDIAGANLRRAEKDLSNAVIASPVDGTITKLNAEVGELVLVGTLNNPASVIMEVADLSDMLFRAKIDESNVAPVRAGQAATVYINAYGDRKFPAAVERVKLYRQRDLDNTFYFEAELKLASPEDLVLRSGLTANADIEVETIRDVVLVPSQAVVDRAIDELPGEALAGNPRLDRTKKFARVVFLMEEGLARARVVWAGPSDLTRTVVTQGLRSGESVVAGPFKSLQEIKDGRKLRLKGEKAESKGGAGKGTEDTPAGAPR